MMTLQIGKQGRKQKQNNITGFTPPIQKACDFSQGIKGVFLKPSTPPRSLARGWAGFTLLEILLVVVIIAIVVSIATPQFRKTLTTIHLANTAQDIAQFMRFLRSAAITEKTTYQLKFDLSARKYYAQKITGERGSSYDKSRFIPENINIAASISTINFYPDGSIDKATIFLFKGKSDYFKDMEKAINKEFDLGQVQSIAHTEYIYTITTQPSIGRIEVAVPE